jgi:hypothetical protein
MRLTAERFDWQDVADAMTERLSAALRIPSEEASQLMDEAASWRTTKKGRSLIDRKLRKTVLVNVPVVLELFLHIYQLTPMQVRVRRPPPANSPLSPIYRTIRALATRHST